MATRTTHPLSLTLLNTLLQRVQPGAPEIVNRYQWLTKKDVVSRIAEYGGARKIARAVSCTSVREQETLRTHCGACSQCLDRRFAILAAGLGEYDPDEIYHTDVLIGRRETLQSCTMAVEWTRSMLRFGDIEDRDFLKEFTLELTRIFLGHPGSPKATTLSMTLEMHRRQAGVVSSALGTALRDKSAELVAGTLPQTGLLRMHVGSCTASALPTDPRTVMSKPATSVATDGEDVVPAASDALRVAFWKEDERFIVAIAGIGRVTGKPAQVPHGLKTQFDADRSEDLDPSIHAFIPPGRIDGLDTWSNAAVRTAVKRCRASLAEDFKRLFGHPPTQHLLIQNKPSKGYRLDPSIRVIRPEETL